MRRARLGWLGILLGAGMALLGACGGDDKPDPRTPPANVSAAFKEGYDKGCPAGLEGAAKQGSNWNNSKVDQRYGQDTEYKKGWDQGYFTCYDSQRSTSIFSGINPF